MAGRIYVVKDESTVSLVRAVSPARALQHVVKSQYAVSVATPDDVAEFMGMGCKVEIADWKPETPPAFVLAGKKEAEAFLAIDKASQPAVA